MGAMSTCTKKARETWQRAARYSTTKPDCGQMRRLRADEATLMNVYSFGRLRTLESSAHSCAKRWSLFASGLCASVWASLLLRPLAEMVRALGTIYSSILPFVLRLHHFVRSFVSHRPARDHPFPTGIAPMFCEEGGAPRRGTVSVQAGLAGPLAQELGRLGPRGR